MAGPSIAVRVIGDITQMAQTFEKIASSGESTSQKLRDGFKGVVSAFSNLGIAEPFVSAFDQMDEALAKVVEDGKKIAPALIGVGGALAGIGVGLSSLGSSDKAAHQQLQSSVEATGKSYEDYAGQVESAITTQEKYGNSADKTQDALKILTDAMKDPAKALEYLGTASDLAASKHEDLSTAATQLGKTYNGSTRLLKEFGEVAGPTVTKATAAVTAATKEGTAAATASDKAQQHLADVHAELAGKTNLTTAEQIKLRDAQAAADQAAQKSVDSQTKLAAAQGQLTAATSTTGGSFDDLATKLKGRADDSANTFTGHLDAMKAKFEDVAASIGTKYGPAITTVGTAMAGLGALFQTLPAIWGVMSAAWDLLAGAELAAAAPYIIIIAGLAAIAIAAYELYEHWDAVWGFIQKIISDVWQWIVDHWPLLLDVLLGPIGVAAGLIIQHWSEIVGAAQAVWNWIVGNWPLLLAILTGPFGLAVYEIKGHWDDIVGFFSGIPGRIASAVGDVASLLYSKGSDIFQGLIDGITSLLGSVPDIPGAILKAVGNLGSLLYDAGRQVIQGLIDGIGSMFGSLGSKISDGLGGLVGGAKKILGVLSPSTVFHEIGVNTMQGFVNGMAAVDITAPVANAIPAITSSGGLMGASGLVYPIGGAGSTSTLNQGPAVNIEHAQFSNEVDIDLLMRRAGWYQQTRAA